MIVKIGAMYCFISRTKTIEVLPGDAGQITFDDYYGNEHLVAVTKQWLELLVDNKKLKAMGAQSTSGILLTGKPGVGKTYLAKALAGEADCAFLGIDGTSLTAMFLGIGALKVMNFANKARKWAKEHGACIWFIDEIDAIAGNRGMVQENNQSDPAKEWWDYTPAQVFRMVMGGMGGGGQAVLSRLLIEMDGMTEIKLRDRIENKMREWFGIEAIDPGIVLYIGATNRPDALDPAITRSGRFSKKITVDSPDKRSRRLIFEGYLRKVNNKVSDNDVNELVANTSWATPADISVAVVEDAPRIAIFRGQDHITFDDVEDAMYEQLVGIKNPISDFDPTQRKQVAIHEAGHVVTMHIARPEKRIAKASIVRRGGGVLGFALDVDIEDIYAMPLNRIKKDIFVSLAGDVATEIGMKERWTGASGDYRAIISRMHALALHGEFANRIPLSQAEPFNDRRIAKSAQDFMEECRAEVEKMLSSNWELVEAITDALLEKDELVSAEIYELLGAEPPVKGASDG